MQADDAAFWRAVVLHENLPVADAAHFTVVIQAAAADQIINHRLAALLIFCHVGRSDKVLD